MSMDLAKKTFSTQPDYLIAGNAEIVTAVKEASAALKSGAPVVLNSDICQSFRQFSFSNTCRP